jgi:hypothetical protein
MCRDERTDQVMCFEGEIVEKELVGGGVEVIDGDCSSY